MYISKTVLKAVCLGICALGATQLASAQDRVYTSDGKVIDAKVKEVNQRSIVYRRWDNQDGADYVLTRREVERIVYENGTEESFDTQPTRRSPFPPPPGRRNTASRSGSRNDNNDDFTPRKMNPAYGRNILAVAPIQMSLTSVAGVGVHYERVIDKGGIVSLYVPVAFSFYQDEASTFSPTFPNTQLEANRVYAYAYPGIKFYPGGSGRRLSYSVGPSVGLGFGTVYKESTIYVPGGGYTRRVSEEGSFQAGFIINNGLNIQATPHLYVGTEFGVGITYYDNRTEDFVVGDGAMLQFNFKIGYRF